MVLDVLTQTDRLLALDTPLGPDTMLITSFSASEQMSGLFSYDIEMVAERIAAAAITADALIGQKVNIHLSLTNEYVASPRRHFSGIVSRFVQRHADRRFVHYRAEVVPWFWLLTLTRDCRIYQEKSALEIITSIFDELKSNYSDLVAWRDATTKQYTKLDYCVQYRESAFQFVSRLMEEEGIFYFFEHEEDKHTLVLADAPAAYRPCPNQSTAVYVPEGGWSEFDNPVMSWEVKNELRPGKYALRDFHMQMPSKSLEVVEPTGIDCGGNSCLEIFDYPGEYARRFNAKARSGEVEPEASKLIKVRMEEEETPFEEAIATSLCRGFTPGFTFKLTEHFQRSANAKYLVTSVQHSVVQTPSYVTEEQGVSGEPYRNTFTCIPDTTSYRPTRRTPKPVVQGPQTAIVVGKPGEEIWTDEFSRVKVQFHWDRKGQKDDKSSCWIRVSQPWAGKGWGGVSIPRIGQEVVVDFLEGDPDQPIITGRVYNADSMPPYALPGQGVVSGMKSNSSPGGGGYNEMSMNDTKGKEAITIHAQYDMGTTVEHDDTQTVHNNRTITVDGTHTETIEKDTTVTINTGNHTVSVNKGNDAHNVLTGNQDVTVKTGNATLSVSSGNREVSVPVGLHHVTAKNVLIEGTQDIKLHCGGSSITLNTGDIELRIGGSTINMYPAMLVITSPLVKINC